MSDQKTILPIQIGHQRKSATKTSVLVFGKGTDPYLGMGANLAPDDLEKLEINISKKEGTGAAATYKLMTTISINIEDLVDIISENVALTASTATTKIELKFKEVAVCVLNTETQESEEKRMLILGSEPYAANP